VLANAIDAASTAREVMVENFIVFPNHSGECQVLDAIQSASLLR
jgi:hypothetical protein